jgi:hypothetical protein
MLSTSIAALVVVVSILAVSGCGHTATTTSSNSIPSKTSSGAGSGSANATTSETTVATGSSRPLAKIQFTTNANAICKRMHAQLLTINNKGKKPTAEQAFSQAATYQRIALSQFQKLNPPTEFTDDWNQMLSTLRTLVNDTTRYVEYVKTRKMGEANRVANSYGSTKSQGIAAAKHDGLRECELAF